ncbi:MAG TPA: hypothetical protein VL485_03150 [Ktedonobacteraceae bacterium]|jgi:hypothetical protein|nr:hypothetical protein [Ktedonobacteraceae bacterium]
MVLTAAIWIGMAFLVVVATVISSILIIRSHTKKVIQVCDQIQHKFKVAEINDIKETLALQLEMNTQYHKDILFRVNLSFIFALIFAGIGILLFFSIVIFMVFGLSSNITTTVVSVVAGTFVQVLSGVSFYLYNRESDRLQTFHKSLERLQNYMLANSICQGLEGIDKAHTCSRLSLIIASATGDEGHAIGEIIKQRAVLATEQQQLPSHNGHSAQSVEV